MEFGQRLRFLHDGIPKYTLITTYNEPTYEIFVCDTFYDPDTAVSLRIGFCDL